MFEEYFTEIPAYTLSRNTLTIIDPKRNCLLFYIFKLIFKGSECYTEKTEVRKLVLAEVEMATDPSCSAECRDLLAQNLKTKLQLMDCPPD